MTPQNNSNSNSEDHWSIAVTNIRMKKLEILSELAKCDMETWSEQMLLEKWCWNICLTQGCHKPSIYRKHRICKGQYNEAPKGKGGCCRGKGEEGKELRRWRRQGSDCYFRRCPDKLIAECGAQSVTFNWTQITFAVNVQSSQKWSHTFERTYKVELDWNPICNAVRFSPVLVWHPHRYWKPLYILDTDHLLSHVGCCGPSLSIRMMGVQIVWLLQEVGEAIQGGKEKGSMWDGFNFIETISWRLYYL